ncbi:MAG: hypothetical protein QOH93_1814 [Chloroflexia bacterium]|nr:hypothetical protein [Chloroflexia bacterium]
MAVMLEDMQQTGTQRQPEDAPSAPATPSTPLPGPIGFIGAGKVGTALASLLHARGVDVRAVAGRTMTGSRRMAASAGLEPGTAASRAATVARSSVVFLTVPDDAIGPLCQEIAASGGWREGQGVVHCSGALPSSVLQPARDMGALVASFHPLQTFASLEAAVAHMPGSTFAIEGDSPLVGQLDLLAQVLDGVAIHLSATQKTLYHAAAVIASNYTVTLAALASGLLVSQGIAPDEATALRYLMPLLRGTVDNLETLGLPGALTGPIARGDAGTVARHLAALDESAPELARVYRDLGKSTLPIAVEKSHLARETIESLEQAFEEKEP